MKKTFSVPAVAVIITLLLSCSAAEAGRRMPDASRSGQPKVSTSSLEKKIHALINRERKKHGLTQLEWNDTLAAVAHKHSKDMGTRNYFSHYSPEGHDFLYRYKKEGYACGIRVGHTIYEGAENIFQNNLYDKVTILNGREYYDWNSEDKIAETTVSGWMQSPGHRKNILTPHWGKEGIGVFITHDGKVYITQNFC